ncbi:MAG: transcriptional regulator [Moraxellaceae bacterium]|nr:MAG: transcriptional regulator [Moraxellaceae bacterium]
MVLAAELIAVLLTLNASTTFHWSWDSLALYSIQIQWISLLSAAIICKLRPWLGLWSPQKAGLISYLVVLVITLILSFIGQLLLQFFTGPQIADSYKFSINVRQLFVNFLTAAILAGISLRYLYLQQQLRNQQQSELQARIQALQSRIRPHFLFNSMNSIASLIGSDPDTAERVIEDLAELFRASLAEPTLIPLERELTLCRRYLEIEQLRLGSRLSLDWQIGPLDEGIKIPSLMLQPLVENAIFHGIEPLPKGGRVLIKISQAKNQLMIAIVNPYPVSKKNVSTNANHENSSENGNGEHRHNSMALDNIRHRLRVHYGNAARLSSSEEHGLFTTYIFCPLTR